MDRGENYDRHVASQPAAIEALLAGPEVPRLDPARPVVFSGIGTSLHACRVAAGWVRLLTGGAIRPAAIDAHDLALLEGVQPIRPVDAPADWECVVHSG